MLACGMCVNLQCLKLYVDPSEGLHEVLYLCAETEEARLQLSKSLLEEALKHGFVTCRTMVCLLVGVAGAGKTHTKHLLFRWAPPESRNSTPVATRPIQAIRVGTQGGKLREVDPDQLDKILACTVANGVPLEKTMTLQIFCCFRMQKQTKSTGLSPPRAYPHLHSVIENTSSEIASCGSLSSESASHRNCYCCFGSDSELQQTAKSALDKTARQIANTSEPQHLLDCDWIYLIDSGGQVEFLEVLPAFLQQASVCLFVTKLSEMLNERPKIEYFENGKSVSEPTLCPFTNEEMLMRCVQTIQHGNTNHASQLLMVGTHRDLEHQCSESRRDKNHRLIKLLHKFKQSLIFRGQEMNQLIFPLNAKNPGRLDHEVASEITKMIMNASSSLEPRKTPISWFKFEQHIKKIARDDHRKIMHREECLQIARYFHLSKKDLNAALDHLASFSVVHYYPHVLPDVVFIDPQFLLDKISELVKYHYQLRHDPQPNTAVGGELVKFRNEGCITLKLIKKKQFAKQYTSFFTPADFLRLINDRLIVAQLVGKDEYFMPCLLRTMQSQEVDQEVDRYRVASGVAPLAIHFSTVCVPCGVFCSLVAFLRSSQNPSPWCFFPHPKNATEPQCLTRNCIKFQLPEGAPGSLTLIDAFSHFEVHVNAPYDVHSSLCPSIWHTLIEGIQKAAETLKYSQLVPKQAFLCKHEDTQPHLALPADAFDYWTCELKPDTVYGHLTDEHLVWCPEKGNNMRMCMYIEFV